MKNTDNSALSQEADAKHFDVFDAICIYLNDPQHSPADLQDMGFERLLDKLSKVKAPPKRPMNRLKVILTHAFPLHLL